MSVEVVRLLLGLGASEREVEALLASAAAAGKSLAKTLVDQGSPLFEPLERELVRRELPSLEMVRPAPEEVALLPAGLCERLGAVPVRRDGRSGRVDVAALDPLDPHVADELEFHLGAKVRVLRARPDALLPALGPGARAPSGPPLPLVRKPPQTERAGPPSTQAPLTTRERRTPAAHDEDGEPVLSLARPKPVGAPVSAVPSPEALADVLLSLEAAEAPEAAVALLIRGMAPARAVVLAVRSGTFEGRAASPGIAQEAVRKIRMPGGEASVIDSAVRSGLYLGALPLTPVHAALRSLVGAEGEVYVVPVTASGRASLILVTEIRPFASTVEATRRADELARAAGSALTRIVRSKKRRR